MICQLVAGCQISVSFEDFFMRTRVKICGITRNEDAQFAVESGVDAIGLVFYEKSPRYVNNVLAAEISQSIPAFVTRVALFKDADKSFIRSVLQQVEIDLIQFHGSESAEFCEQFSLPYIKALGMKDFRIEYSHRGIFNRFLHELGLEDYAAQILRTVDKLKALI